MQFHNTQRASTAISKMQICKMWQMDYTLLRRYYEKIESFYALLNLYCSEINQTMLDLFFTKIVTKQRDRFNALGGREVHQKGAMEMFESPMTD